MKILEIVLFIIFFNLLFSPSISSAQVVINPGSTTFSTAIIIYQAPQVSGDLNSLIVYWSSYFISEEGYLLPSSIGVKCYLNCNPITDSQQCNGQQNCTYLGPEGYGACRISPVQYVYPLSLPENMTCLFYNPSYPSVQYKNTDGTYPNTTFYPVNFNLFVSPNITVDVGDQLEMQIVLQNIGMIQDRYVYNITAYPSNLVAWDQRTRNATVGPLVGNSYGNVPQSETSVAKMRILSTISPITLLVNASSLTNNTIFYTRTVQVRAGVSSLPDFDWTGILQIVVVATAAFFLMSRRKKL